MATHLWKLACFYILLVSAPSYFPSLFGEHRHLTAVWNVLVLLCFGLSLGLPVELRLIPLLMVTIPRPAVTPYV